MSRVVLVSTYELGAQPLGLAGPAAALGAAGHEVATVDLSVEQWPTAELGEADAVGFSVPMHTALRLALDAVARLRAERPTVPVCFYGLYAKVAARAGALRRGDLAVAGEVGPSLVRWLAQGAGRPSGVLVELGEKGGPSVVPQRRGLVPLGAYAHLVDGDSERLVGTVEASRGCNHRCRHCPVPVVYDGRSRPVDPAAVAADIEAVVASGAGHVRFADADFLNRPAHALQVARALNAAHPEVSFDATIKVSHLLRHRDVVAELAALGLRFVVSAFESTSDLVLSRLDKGHTTADAADAVDSLRRLGVEIRPSLLPFTPWTRRLDLVEILDFVAAHDLVDNVDPVQYTIRLLIPPGSLVLEGDDPVREAALRGYDEEALGYAWASADPLLDELQIRIADLVEEATTAEEETALTYRRVRAAVFSAFGEVDPGLPARVGLPGPEGLRPRLSEAWFCCAEPRRSQRHAIATGR